MTRRAFQLPCIVTICVILLLIAAARGIDEVVALLELIGGFAIFLCAWRVLNKVSRLIERYDLLGPTVAFPVAYVLWFTVGSINLIELPDAFDLGMFAPIPARMWVYYTAGLAAYWAGSFRSKKNPVPLWGVFRNPWVAHRFWALMAALIAMMTASYALIISKVGIPALDPSGGETRLGLNGVAYAVFITTGWTIFVFLPIYLWTKSVSALLRGVAGVFLLVTAALLISLGGRSNLFVPLLTVVILCHFLRRRLSLRQVLVACLALLVGASLFGYARDNALSAGQSVDWADTVGVPSYLVPLLYSGLYIRYTVATFRDITSVIPAQVPYQHGTLTLAPLRTLLPGHHEMSDMFFKEVLGSQFIGAGQPAGLLGPLYGDFGTLGVVIGMLLLGLLTAWTFGWMWRGGNVIRAAIYAWLLQTLLVGLMAGPFPYITTLWLPVLWALLDWIMTTPAGSSVPVLRAVHAN